MDAIEQLRLDVELLRAARKERAAAVRELIAAGANLSARELWGNTPLHEAAWYGNEAVARALLGAGAQVHQPNRRGSTPLHRAACKNRVDCVQLLLDAGALPNARDKEDETPLHEAVRYRSAETAQLLLAHGAEVDARNKHGMTPLHAAIITESIECERVLLAAGAAIDSRTHAGDTPLHTAARHCCPASMRMLMEMGVDIHAKNAEGATPLLNATFAHISWRVDCLQMLVEAGAEVKVHDEMGNTPLLRLAHVCADLEISVPREDKRDFAAPKHTTFKEFYANYGGRNGYYDANAAMLLLLEAGAELNTPDTRQATVLDWALLYCEPDVVHTLRLAGAKYRYELMQDEHEMELREKICPIPLPEPDNWEHWQTPEDVLAYARLCLQQCPLEGWEWMLAPEVESPDVWYAGINCGKKQLLISPWILTYGYVEARICIVCLLAHALNYTVCQCIISVHLKGWKRWKVLQKWKLWLISLGAPGCTIKARRLEMPSADAVAQSPSTELATHPAFYVLCHRETGEVFRKYAKRPRFTAAKLAKLTIRKRELETRGKLCIAYVPSGASERAIFATYDELNKLISCMHERAPEISTASLRDYRRHGYRLCYIYMRENMVNYDHA